MLIYIGYMSFLHGKGNNRSICRKLGYISKTINQPSSFKTILPEIQGNWWASLRQGAISGKYEGEITASSAGPNFLELRIDIDPRFANSPIMNRISGDFYQVQRDFSTQTIRVIIY